MGFLVKKKLDLGFLGEGWTGGYIHYSALTFKESRGFSGKKFDEQNANSEENLDFVIELLNTHFIDGKGFDSESRSLVDLTADGLEELPVDVITKSVELLVGGPSENLPTN